MMSQQEKNKQFKERIEKTADWNGYYGSSHASLIISTIVHELQIDKEFIESIEVIAENDWELTKVLNILKTLYYSQFI